MKKILLIGIFLMTILNITACSLQTKNDKTRTSEQSVTDALDESSNQTNEQPEELIGLDTTKAPEASKTDASGESKNQSDISKNELQTGNGLVEVTNQPAEENKTVPSEAIQTNKQSETDAIEVVTINTTHKVYKDYESLYNDADLIIIGEPRNDILDDEVVITYYDLDPSRYGASGKKRLIQNVRTFREVSIQKVLKGAIEGDSMKVSEIAGVVEESERKKMFIASGYSSLQKDNRYLLFLSNKGTEHYYILGVNQGKFNTDGKDMKEKALETTHTQFSQLKKEALSKLEIE